MNRFDFAVQGRSPRARGRPHDAIQITNSPRSIPACAGETSRSAGGFRAPGVDPRVRGGDRSSSTSRAISSGRSPRARGRLPVPGSTPPLRRSIPACAGETARRGCRDRPSRVDPRVRGGDASVVPNATRARGRSPRARGRPPSRDWRSGRAGSIPACAGETWWRRSSRRPSRVDPRVRGGDASARMISRAGMGRSPRARGRRCTQEAAALGQGSIPACAGETSSATCTAPLPRVDPRVRGGDSSGSWRGLRVGGRSPRARGRPVFNSSWAANMGSIPACAGETEGFPRSASCARVDPRVRGGDSNADALGSVFQGRSPRARGRRRHSGPPCPS